MHHACGDEAMSTCFCMPVLYILHKCKTAVSNRNLNYSRTCAFPVNCTTLSVSFFTQVSEMFFSVLICLSHVLASCPVQSKVFWLSLSFYIIVLSRGTAYRRIPWFTALVYSLSHIRLVWAFLYNTNTHTPQAFILEYRHDVCVHVSGGVRAVWGTKGEMNTSTHTHRRHRTHTASWDVPPGVMSFFTSILMANQNE